MFLVYLICFALLNIIGLLSSFIAIAALLVFIIPSYIINYSDYFWIYKRSSKMRKIRILDVNSSTNSYIEKTRTKQQKYVTTGINYNDLESL